MDDIMSLASENFEYELTKKEMIDEGYVEDKIYQYDFYTTKTELIPEPDNPHDPNAIKVMIDNVHVGYIKSGSCIHIHKLIRENRIEKIDSEIAGGKYKYLYFDEDTESYTMEKDETPYYVHVFIIEKNDK